MNAKKRLEFTKRFFKKLALIEEYIALDNPAAAKKVAQHIYDVAESLEAFPMLGKLSDGVAGRELVLDKYPYTIMYRLTASKIIIRSVVHQSQILR